VPANRRRRAGEAPLGLNLDAKFELCLSRRNEYNRRMPYLNDCKEILRRLIAKGDINGIRLAERAINEYLAATPANARKSGLRLL
jgi:hypothetical protein